MAAFHNTVRLGEIFDEKRIFTFNATAAITSAGQDAVGKAVTLHSTANTVDLAVTDEFILGRIEQVELRQTGTVVSVARGITLWLPYTGTAPDVGDSVDGSGTAGVVKAMTANDPSKNQVVEVDVTNTRVLVLFP